MNQFNWKHHPDSRGDSTTSAVPRVTMLGFILAAAMFSGSASAVPDKSAPTRDTDNTNIRVANPEFTILGITNRGITNQEVTADPGRQATITAAGKASTHYYASEFAKTTDQASKDIATRPDRQIASYNPYLWIFDIALNLHTDHDHDGHYSNFSLTLDLDTTFTATTVYAVLYLANEGGPWNEYAVTGNFTVSGSGSADTFSLTAELDSGYPSGYYNHYIEVYDAYSHELIGTYGPDDSHQLYALPIESRMHDDGITFGSDVSLSFSGTGAIGPGPLLLALAGLMVRRRQKARVKHAT